MTERELERRVHEQEQRIARALARNHFFAAEMQASTIDWLGSSPLDDSLSTKVVPLKETQNPQPSCPPPELKKQHGNLPRSLSNVSQSCMKYLRATALLILLLILIVTFVSPLLAFFFNYSSIASTSFPC